MTAVFFVMAGRAHGGLQKLLAERLTCSLHRRIEYIVVQVPISVSCGGEWDSLEAAARHTLDPGAGIRAGRHLLQLLRGPARPGVGAAAGRSAQAAVVDAPCASHRQSAIVEPLRFSPLTAQQGHSTTSPRALRLPPVLVAPGSWLIAGRGKRSSRIQLAEHLAEENAKIWHAQRLQLRRSSRCLAAGMIGYAVIRWFRRLQMVRHAPAVTRACLWSCYRSASRLLRDASVKECSKVDEKPELSDDQILHAAIGLADKERAVLESEALASTEAVVKRLRIHCRCGAIPCARFLAAPGTCQREYPELCHDCSAGTLALICSMKRCKRRFVRCLRCFPSLMSVALRQDTSPATFAFLVQLGLVI